VWLCRKIIHLLQYLENNTKVFGITQELGASTTGMARYFKLLIRIGLQNSLQLSRGWEVFVNEIATRRPTNTSSRTMTAAKLRMHAGRSLTCCFYCNEVVVEACYVTSEGRPACGACVICPNCKSKGFQLDKEFLSTAQGFRNGREKCSFCAAPLPDHLCYRHGLDAFVTLLWTAIATSTSTCNLSFEEVLKFEVPASSSDTKTAESSVAALSLDDISKMTFQRKASGN